MELTRARFSFSGLRWGLSYIQYEVEVLKLTLESVVTLANTSSRIHTREVSTRSEVPRTGQQEAALGIKYVESSKQNAAPCCPLEIFNMFCTGVMAKIENYQTASDSWEYATARSRRRIWLWRNLNSLEKLHHGMHAIPRSLHHGVSMVLREYVHEIWVDCWFDLIYYWWRNSVCWLVAKSVNGA